MWLVSFKLYDITCMKKTFIKYFVWYSTLQHGFSSSLFYSLETYPSIFCFFTIIQIFSRHLENHGLYSWKDWHDGKSRRTSQTTEAARTAKHLVPFAFRHNGYHWLSSKIFNFYYSVLLYISYAMQRKIIYFGRKFHPNFSYFFSRLSTSLKIFWIFDF